MKHKRIIYTRTTRGHSVSLDAYNIQSECSLRERKAKNLRKRKYLITTNVMSECL